MIEFLIGLLLGLGVTLVVKLYNILLHIDSYKSKWDHERWKRS